jgi:hypothetical protein
LLSVRLAGNSTRVYRLYEILALSNTHLNKNIIIALAEQIKGTGMAILMGERQLIAKTASQQVGLFNSVALRDKEKYIKGD